MSIVLMLSFVAIFLILSGRFLYIQTTGEVAGVSLQEWADKTRTNQYSLPAERGRILDRNEMSLVQDRPTYKVYAIVDETHTGINKEPLYVQDARQTAEELAPLLEMEPSDVLETIDKGKSEGRFQVEFGSDGKNLTQDIKEQIEELELPGINFEKDIQRYYPNGMFASHVLGLVDKLDGEQVGLTGVEQMMNDVLAGESGHISYKRDKYNAKLLQPEEIVKEAKDGNDVYLTIDQKIQTLLEDAMSEVNEQYEPERITAAVMDPKTGEVLAMSSRPSYDPNQLGTVENWYNDVISTPFEPGSTMKIFTLAAAIEEGEYNPTEYFQSGKYQISEGAAIHDWDNKGWGSITFREGIQRSSNVAAALLAYDKVGPEKFYEYLQAFEFDQPTGIDLPGEDIGKIMYNYKSEKITTSYGQGTTVTPIQQMKALTAVANNGEMLQPYVIKAIKDPNTDQVVEEKSPNVVGNPISAETAKKVRDELGTVVSSENGTGRNYKLDDYSVAGKTGTAQIPDRENPQPYMTGHGNYEYSFLGMAPKDDPQLMMYVSVKRPELSVHEVGSEPVSFIFKNVMGNSLHYLNINPDMEAQQTINTYEMPEILDKSVTDVKTELEDKGLRVTVIGNGDQLQGANVKAGEELLPNERIFLLTANPVMPDLSGWSVRDVLKFSETIDLDISVHGSGYAVSQSISQGKNIQKQDKLTVEFTSPNAELEEEDPPEQEME